MKGKCQKVEMKMSITNRISGVREDEKDHVTSDGRNFRNLGNGYGTITQPAELSITVLVEVKIPIDSEFREKFQKPNTRHANLTERRMKRIQETMPDIIDVRVTGNPKQPFKVENGDIADWFSRAFEE